MVDLRKILVIFVIGVLFAVLTFSTIEAVYPAPEYNDFCDQRAKSFIEIPPSMNKQDCEVLNVPDEEWKKCSNDGGFINYNYDSNGCAESFYCNYCEKDYDSVQEKHNLFNFIISAGFALIGILIAFLLPKKEELNEWIGAGFLLGGLFSLFFGTAIYFGDMVRWLRPIIILVELILVIFLSYKKLRK